MTVKWTVRLFGPKGSGQCTVGAKGVEVQRGHRAGPRSGSLELPPGFAGVCRVTPVVAHTRVFQVHLLTS